MRASSLRVALASLPCPALPAYRARAPFSGTHVVVHAAADCGVGDLGEGCDGPARYAYAAHAKRKEAVRGLSQRVSSCVPMHSRALMADCYAHEVADMTS